MQKAKKSLGQNWLKSESATKEIIKAAEIKAGDLVLEIGPGRGALTQALLDAGAQVLAIEKDDNLINFLQEKFNQEILAKKFILTHGDILDINFSEIFKTHILSNLSSYKLVANIPYYITGQIVRKFLSEEEIQPSLMVLMVQKEVAKRIVAGDGKESLLSISVKVYSEPKYVKTVPAGAFEPKPSVDSAILQIKNISRDFFLPKPGLDENLSEERFFEVLRKSFGQKRKLLKGNLKELAPKIEEFLEICQIPDKARAEDLNIKNWQCLAQKIKN